MKSLSINAATFALAVSLASTAQANETDALFMHETVEQPVLEMSDIDMGGVEATIDHSLVEGIDIDALTFDLADATVGANFVQAPLVTSQASQGTVEARSLTAHYGNIDPFYGDIDAFWDDISPFYGDIKAFWDDINPFWDDISPFYGDIKAFWGDISAFYGDIGAFDADRLAMLGNYWNTASVQMQSTDAVWKQLVWELDDGRYVLEYDGTPDKILNAFNEMIGQAEAQFGAAYEAETGKSFRDDFVTDFFASHGIDLNNKSSLAGKSAADRAALFLNWHDSLMQFSGIDQVDHWMAAVNWTPAVTQIQGAGRSSIIGIIDSSFGSENIAWQAGSANALGGHGAGVASLITGAHDGKGVMGIAPNATITSYNPFGTDGTATWDDVAAGILALKSQNNTTLNNALGSTQRASVINLSLGEAGWVVSQGLADILGRQDISDHSHDTIYVIAAGNEGVVQPTDIEWTFGATNSDSDLLKAFYDLNPADDTAAIFVGSLGIDGKISHFSNQPGNACLLDNGVCNSGNELMNYFIVAPGEMLLVDDGIGGVVRRSGTSFAAPLVSGAITLLHDRWPWLAQNPNETAEIIFRSARDLGAPGVDPVYGWGLLDVTASQSPLDFNNTSMTIFYRERKRYASSQLSASYVLANGLLSRWEDMAVYFTLFENIGDTHRDFVVPMSSVTRGTQTDALGHGYQSMQDFVGDRFARWFLSNGADSDGDGVAGIRQIKNGQARQTGDWTLNYEAIMPRFSEEGTFTPVHNAATLTNPNGKMAFTLGHGQGAMALSGDRFGVISDYDRDSGGVNPVLGFASGEVFASASYKVAPNTTVRVGYSDNKQDWDEVDGLTAGRRASLQAFDAHQAHALTLDVEHKVSDKISLNAQFTRLSEDNALLGAQSANDAFLGQGANTNAVTLSASIDFGDDFSFELSATGAETETADGQAFASAAPILSTAGQAAVTKRGILNRKDALRVSVGQPLTIENGKLEFTSLAVVDRQTGETGMITQEFGIETKRRYTGEIVYATPLTDKSEFGLFGRYVSAGNSGEEQSYMVGANVGLRF